MIGQGTRRRRTNLPDPVQNRAVLSRLLNTVQKLALYPMHRDDRKEQRLLDRSRQMSRTFAYCRVSTLEQTVENQIHEIEAAGFSVQKQRIITETVSGSSAIEQRRGFMKLLDRLE